MKGGGEKKVIYSTYILPFDEDIQNDIASFLRFHSNRSPLFEFYTVEEFLRFFDFRTAAVSFNFSQPNQTAYRSEITGAGARMWKLIRLEKFAAT